MLIRVIRGFFFFLSFIAASSSVDLSRVNDHELLG